MYVDTHVTVISVGVSPAVAAGVGLLQDLGPLRCITGRSHSKEMSTIRASSYAAPPAIPPTEPQMPEKPALFPREE